MADQTPTSSKKKIIIVDDDKFLLDMYSMKFSECGLEVLPCHNAEEALSELREGNEFDAVLLDVIMPGINGFEMIEKIKEEKLAREAAIIVLSNQGGDEDLQKGEELGADGYIVKANTIPSEVLEKVLAIIEKTRKRLAGENE